MWGKAPASWTCRPAASDRSWSNWNWLNSTRSNCTTRAKRLMTSKLKKRWCADGFALFPLLLFNKMLNWAHSEFPTCCFVTLVSCFTYSSNPMFSTQPNTGMFVANGPNWTHGVSAADGEKRGTLFSQTPRRKEPPEAEAAATDDVQQSEGRVQTPKQINFGRGGKSLRRFDHEFVSNYIIKIYCKYMSPKNSSSISCPHVPNLYDWLSAAEPKRRHKGM